jgi:hypothetical protein
MVLVRKLTFLLCMLLPATLFAELAPEQKVTEFRQLAGLYAKNYGPYEWKRDTQNFDLLQLSPWLERARATKNDLDFADLMIEYVAALNDGHDILTLRSTWAGFLGFVVDFYDKKPLIDGINRTQLPRTRYPIEVGDELISIDGVTPEEMTRRYWKYSVAANDLATKRQSALWYTYRPQSVIPRAHEVGEEAVVVVKRFATGTTDTYRITWDKFGVPMTSFGTLPVPGTAQALAAAAAGSGSVKRESPARRAWNQLMMNISPRVKHQKAVRAVLGVGVVAPIFAPPAGFTQRLGRSGFDNFYSGTYTFDGQRIGYIRIPDFAPDSPNFAASQFVTEMQFFEANTDALVIDLIRNPGGSVSYANFLISAIMPGRHRVLGFELRASSFWVSVFSQLLMESDDSGDPPWVVQSWREALNAVKIANSENRGRTGALPLDSGPDFEASLDRPGLTVRGANAAYTKPILVLVDENTASGGDAFAAMVQDNGRGLIYGVRTMGLGGNVIDWSLDGYAEVDTRITTSLMVRKNPVFTGGQYPVTSYVENVGVHPDIEDDYMTEDNLRNRGRTYVESFSKAVVNYIRILRASGAEK